MALRVERESRPTTRSWKPAWLVAPLPLALGVPWAVWVARDGLELLGSPEDAPAGWLLLSWAGYAVLASLTYSLLLLWPPRTWVKASLMASAVMAGFVVWGRVDSVIPSGGSARPPDFPAAGDLVLGHTGLGVALLLLLSGIAVVVLWRDGAPHVGSWIGTCAAFLALPSLFFAHWEYGLMVDIPGVGFDLPLLFMGMVLFLMSLLAGGFGLCISVAERDIRRILLTVFTPFGLLILYFFVGSVGRALMGATI